jgi:methyl-accepting chemotaxis protein
VVFVSETGEALEALGQSISTVNHHMDAVVDAAKEQSAQLAEVNRAMTHLDQINRENVELVDETALSAARLMTQTARLKELLDRFRMPSGTRSGAERGSRAA